MSILSIDGVHCAYCNAKNRVSLGTPNHIFVDVDYDSRSPFMKYLCFDNYLSECQNCGYVSPSISKKRKNGAKTMRSQRYINCDGIETENRIIRKYIRNAILTEAESDSILSHMDAWLYVAWACDDAGETELAKKIRKKVLNVLRKYSDIIVSERYLLTIADIYRRSGQFRNVIELFSDCKVANEALQRAIDFEVKLAREGDDTRYKLSHMDVLSIINEEDKFVNGNLSSAELREGLEDV